MHAGIWSDMFLPGLPVLEKILRAAIVYYFLVVALKLAGRRELAQLNAFDLVLLLTIANTVQDAIIGNDNSVSGGLIGATTLLVIDYLMVRVFFEYRSRHRRAPNAEEVLIENGQVRPDALKKELLSTDDLKQAAGKQGFASLKEVERAVLNPDGSFGFSGKKKEQSGREYGEILRRLDQMAELLGRLRPAQGSPGS
jgi:uncharacterized membrane protein YcaP (DUF421 family)